MPAFSLTPVQGYPQQVSEEFPNPLLFAHNDVQFTGPIQIVNFIGGTVTESEIGVLSVSLGGGGGGYTAGANIAFTGEDSSIINAVPSGSDRLLQYNNNGAFGATQRGNYSLNFPSSGSNVLSVNEFIFSPVVYTRTVDLYGNMVGATDKNYFSDGKIHAAYLAGNFVSTIPYPPSGGFVSNHQAMVFVTGGRSDADEDEGLGGSWMTPQGFHFEDYETGRENRYIDIKPMSRNLTPITTPENFPVGLEVDIGGTLYWLPLIAQ